jgi:hypothetical protein
MLERLERVQLSLERIDLILEVREVSRIRSAGRDDLADAAYRWQLDLACH